MKLMPGLARRDLGRLLLVEVAHLLEVGVAGERGVVEHDLGVERDELAGIGHDQGVDLGEVRIGGDEGVVEAAHDLREVLPKLRGDAEEEADASRLVLLEPENRMERQAEDGLGVRLRRLLDLDSRPPRSR